jgi:hypothetical protein
MLEPTDLSVRSVEGCITAGGERSGRLRLGLRATVTTPLVSFFCFGARVSGLPRLCDPPPPTSVLGSIRASPRLVEGREDTCSKCGMRLLYMCISYLKSVRASPRLVEGREDPHISAHITYIGRYTGVGVLWWCAWEAPSDEAGRFAVKKGERMICCRLFNVLSASTCAIRPLPCPSCQHIRERIRQHTSAYVI